MRRHAPMHLAACLGLIAGCSWGASPMSSDEVIQQDPAFSALLQERTALSAEIRQLEGALQVEQKTVLAEIQQRRAALRAKEQATQQQVQELEQRLDPARQLIQAKLQETDEALRRTAATLQSLRRTRDSIDRLIRQQANDSGASAEASSAAAPMADVQSWTTQRATMDQQIPALEAHATTLRRQRTLYQTELRLLRR